VKCSGESGVEAQARVGLNVEKAIAAKMNAKMERHME
jgi:hypothetical protein